MTRPEGKNGNQKGKTPRKPRGFSGFLLLVLLISLFVWLLQSHADPGPNRSPYLFFRFLFAGRLDQVRVKENRVEANVKPLAAESAQAPGEASGRPEPTSFQVVFTSLDPALEALLRDVSAWAAHLDESWSAGASGVQLFAREVEAGQLQVVRAWVLSPRGMEASEAEGDLVFFVGSTGRGQVYGRLQPERRSGGGDLLTIMTLLERQGVQVEHLPIAGGDVFQVVQPDRTLLILLTTVGPWVILIALIWFFFFRQMRAGPGGGVLSFGKSRATLYNKEQRTNITFADVAGIREAREEVSELVQFLKNPQRFQRLGGRIPKGVLLVGPPGTGKTLLAKAIAGEAEVPFFSISGSDFVEMFVGVGASRVRDLFKQARDNSPCLIFLDEVDAVGRKRGSGLGGGHDEREQTLNAILVEMDGFSTDEGIILIAATNRPDVLDPALLRPGRFDRQITIDYPDVQGRQEILAVHARKVQLAKDVDLAVIARGTPSFSGADLAALINEAAILASLRDKNAVEMEDLEEARDRVKWGREKRSRKFEKADRRTTAYHEAGHALAALLMPEVGNLHKVTVVPRGMSLGSTMSLPIKDDYHLRRKQAQVHAGPHAGRQGLGEGLLRGHQRRCRKRHPPGHSNRAPDGGRVGHEREDRARLLHAPSGAQFSRPGFQLRQGALRAGGFRDRHRGQGASRRGVRTGREHVHGTPGGARDAYRRAHGARDHHRSRGPGAARRASARVRAQGRALEPGPLRLHGRGCGPRSRPRPSPSGGRARTLQTGYRGSTLSGVEVPRLPRSSLRVLGELSGPEGPQARVEFVPASPLEERATGGCRGRVSVTVAGDPPRPPGALSEAPALAAELADAVRRYRLLPAGPPGIPKPPQPALMGVLNVTPDSFSDAGRYARLDQALARALELVEQGADILDIGGESSRPGALPVPPDEEIRRILPVLEAVRARTSLPISIDTRKAEVARAALDAGADWINDISALGHDPAMADLLATRGCPVVLMHMRGTPETMQSDVSYADVVAEVHAYLHGRALFAMSRGIAPERILIDPGIGFGKGLPENLEILRRLAELRSLGLPILAGTSRKSFIGQTLGRPVEQRVHGTAATVTAAVLAGARVLRVHDMAAMKDVALMAAAIRGHGGPLPGEDQPMMELLRAAGEVLVLATATYLILRFLRETRGTGVVRGLTPFSHLSGRIRAGDRSPAAVGPPTACFSGALADRGAGPGDPLPAGDSASHHPAGGVAYLQAPHARGGKPRDSEDPPGRGPSLLRKIRRPGRDPEGHPLETGGRPGDPAGRRRQFLPSRIHLLPRQRPA